MLDVTIHLASLTAAHLSEHGGRGERGVEGGPSIVCISYIMMSLRPMYTQTYTCVPTSIHPISIPPSIHLPIHSHIHIRIRIFI